MKKYRLEFAVGVFVLLGLVCLTYMTVKLGKMEAFSTRGYALSARFTSASGLRTGATVEISGVPVGKVSAIALDANSVADVGLTLEANVQLGENTVASIKTSGIIGDRYVSLVPGDGALLPPGGRIMATEPAVDLETLIASIGIGDPYLYMEESYHIHAVFQSVAGLRTGAGVEISGVPVGKVVAIDLDNNYRAKVTMAILPHVALTDEDIASVRSRGLIGGKYIVLSLGGGEPLEPGATISDTESSVDLETLIGKYAFGGVE